MKTLSAYNQQTLMNVIWPEAGTNKALDILRLITISVIGSLLLTVSAKIQVPFYPVPMTMQTFVVLAMAMALGPRLAVAALTLYLAEGAMGLPVFSGTPEKGLGLAYIFGPTGGYLLGFVFATLIVGKLAEKGWDRNFAGTATAMLIGNMAIYVPGILWLGSLLGWDKPVLEWGLYPFLYGDLAKLALATAILPLVWKTLSRLKK